jgi:glycyl-tRNA synthetase beta subunit
MFDAVVASRTQSVLDMDLRLRALERFLKMSGSRKPRGANKRIVNILRKAPGDLSGAVDTSGCRTARSASCSSTSCRWSAR